MHKTQKKLIIANWKMNPKTSKEAAILARAASETARVAKNVEVVIAPPFVHLQAMGGVKLGAQNVFWENIGAHTGEISPIQLKAFGVRHVLVGHSERRALGETNEEVNKKIKAVLESGMKAVLCVGETEKKKEVAFPPVVNEELKEGLRGVKKSLLKNLLVVYEPVWAISTTKVKSAIRSKRADSPKNVFEMSVLIRRELLKMFGKKIAFSTPILYGGSVDEKNAADFVKLGKVDGLLVGAASLNAKRFSEIIRRVSKI